VAIQSNAIFRTAAFRHDILPISCGPSTRETLRHIKAEDINDENVATVTEDMLMQEFIKLFQQQYLIRA